MSYDSTRDSEQLRILDHSIDDFIDRYNQSDGLPGGARRTVILFPGGMGSTLKRARTRYTAGMPTGQTFAYDTVWLTPETFLGGALDLGMKKVAPGKYTDKGDRIVVADGSVKFLGCTPYDNFTAWCGDNGLDWFVFGWDWRRPLPDTGSFFVQQFLPHFRARVAAGCNNADPLADFALVGHSAGGMIVNWILRDDDPNVATMSRAVTVATPFYGYSGQVHRWFEGEPYLNGFADVFKSGVIKVICSLPACYCWQFLDYDTYAQNQALLAADPQYPLPAYPSVDALTGAAADPYDPQTKGGQTRYPAAGKTGFSDDELATGADLLRYLASDIADPLAARFFNIRCVTTQDDTVGEIAWDWVPPTDPSPIHDGAIVPGDGTQPAWSARHVGLATLHPGNVITVKGDDVEHMFALNSPATLQALAGVLGVP